MIVSDELILDTIEKLQKTNKMLCVPFQRDIDNILAYKSVLENSKKDRIEYTVLEHLRRQEHPCCLSEYLTNPSELIKKDFFILYGEVFISALKMFNPMVWKDIFIGDKPFASPLIVFYMSKSIDKRAKAEFNRQVYVQIEHGYKLKISKSDDILIYQKVPRIKNVFRNSKEYTDFFTMTSDVKMNDFTFVYLFYTYQALLLLIFVLHRLIRLMLCNKQPDIHMNSIKSAPNRAKVSPDLVHRSSKKSDNITYKHSL